MRNKLLIAIGVIIVLAIAIWAISAPILSHVVRERVISALEENFASSLQENNLEVSLFPRVTIVGDTIVFHLQDRPGTPPLFTIRKLIVHANLLGLLARHVSSIELQGLDIHIPPRQDKTAEQPKSKSNLPDL